MSVSSIGIANIRECQRILLAWLREELQFGDDSSQSDASRARDALKAWILDGDVPSNNDFGFIVWGVAVNAAVPPDLEWPVSVPEFGKSGRPTAIRKLLDSGGFEVFKSLFQGEFLSEARQLLNPEDTEVTEPTSAAAPRSNRRLRILVGILLVLGLATLIVVIAINGGKSEANNTADSEKQQKQDQKVGDGQEEGQVDPNSGIATLVSTKAKDGVSTKSETPTKVEQPTPAVPAKLSPSDQLKSDLAEKSMAWVKLKDKACAFGGEEVITYAGDLKKPAVECAENFLAFLDARTGTIALSAEQRDQWLLFRRVALNAPASEWTKNPKSCLKSSEIWQGLGRDPQDPTKAKGKAAYDNWDAQINAAKKLIEESSDGELKAPLLK